VIGTSHLRPVVRISASPPMEEELLLLTHLRTLESAYALANESFGRRGV